MGDKVSPEAYNYVLPDKLIAKAPAEPRDSSKLFVYNTSTNEVFIDTFVNLDKYLPAGSLLVFNDTKVVPARVTLYKETGGKVEVLLLLNEYRPGDKYVKAIVDRKVDVGQKLAFDNEHTFAVERQEENIFFLNPEFEIGELHELLYKFGATPIPKYIKDTPLDEKHLRERYQSIFAQKEASVAAPTASLHFTERVLDKLEQKGVDKTFVTLHVGLGTFAPITDENISQKKLHEEFFEITEQSANKISKAKQEKRPVVAVGTTSVRTLESAAAQILHGKGTGGKTEIFIYPPYDYKLVDTLITNFHLPKSSLMMLVDAFLKHKGAQKSLIELYERAISEKYRFYSFGDAMLII